MKKKDPNYLIEYVIYRKTPDFDFPGEYRDNYGSLKKAQKMLKKDYGNDEEIFRIVRVIYEEV